MIHALIATNPFREIAETINSWIDTQQTTTDVNAWNFLMQKVHDKPA